jgi:WhiB family redox-sensing transcriptional regulator
MRWMAASGSTLASWRQVSVTPRTAAATLAALRASRERDPGCSRVRMLLARDRIQAAFVAAELRGDRRRLDAATLAREAGVTTTVARQWLHTFRAARHSDPTLAGLRGEPAERRPATPEQLAALQAAYARGRPQPERRPRGDRPPAAPPAAAPGEGRLAWIGQAACRDADPELFFPERGHARQGTKAKQVCAACPVQGPCRDLAVRAASGRNDDHGIFGGTKPHERTGLRDNQPFDHRKEWLGDRAAAERAHRLAVEVGPQEAAKRLGTYASTLRRAWDQWGLDYPGRPRSSPYARDREHAERAFRLAEELGSVPTAADKLGASRPALRAGWQRFGLGQPDTARARQARQAPRVAQLDWAFLALNPTSTLEVRAAGPAGLAARVRRAEQEATLGYRVTVELTAENRWRTSHLRAWVVGQRARHAQQRAHAGERSPDRDRATPGRERDGDQDQDRPGEPARRRAWRERGRGGGER